MIELKEGMVLWVGKKPNDERYSIEYTPGMNDVEGCGTYSDSWDFLKFLGITLKEAPKIYGMERMGAIDCYHHFNNSAYSRMHPQIQKLYELFLHLDNESAMVYLRSLEELEK